MLVDDTRGVVAPLRGGAGRTQADTEAIRAGLQERYDELQAEYEHAVISTQQLSRAHLADTAGDDDADIGTKTSERERELSVLRSISERREQVQSALRRLADGAYGWCERCGGPIPVERLAVFPWATSCVACKQLLERRAS
jgi:DnaK suppressor protein